MKVSYIWQILKRKQSNNAFCYHNYFDFISFTLFFPSLTTKGRQACDAAQSRMNHILKQSHESEEQAVIGMSTWELAMSVSRPGSGIEKAEQVTASCNCKFLKTVSLNYIYLIYQFIGTIGEGSIIIKGDRNRSYLYNPNSNPSV